MCPDLTRPQRVAVDKVRNIIANGSKAHDFLGVEKELAGKSTGYDHVTEMRNNVRGLLDALGSIRGSLANPTMTADVRLYLESVLRRERRHWPECSTGWPEAAKEVEHGWLHNSTPDRQV